MVDQASLPRCLTRHLKPVAEVEIIREAAETIAQAMERLHRAPYLICIDAECGFVLVNRDRSGGAHG